MNSVTVAKFFTKFSEHLDANYSRPEEIEKNDIRSAPKLIRRLDSLARLIARGDGDNCVAVALVKNEWFITANNCDEIKSNVDEILDGLRRTYLKKGTLRTKCAREYFLDEYLAGITKPNIRRRLKKDVRKFLSAMKTDVFAVKTFNNLLSYGFHIVENPRGLHAEIMQLRHMDKLYEFTDNDKPLKIALGISKLCCKLCAAGICAIQCSCPAVTIKVRGRHGNFYYAWKPSKVLLLNNKKCFKKFVGNEAYDIYAKAKDSRKQLILERLNDLGDYSHEFKDIFKRGRGGVNLDSESSVATDTESSSETSEGDNASEASETETSYSSTSDATESECYDSASTSDYSEN